MTEGPLFLKAELALDSEVKGYLEYGPFGKRWAKTDAINFVAGATTEVILLGLRPDQEVFVRPVVIVENRAYPLETSAAAISGSLPNPFGAAEPDYFSSSLVASPQEVFCHVDKTNSRFICLDRSATPIWYYENSECPPNEASRALSSAEFAYYCKGGDGLSDLLIVDSLGRTKTRYNLEDLAKDSDCRFTHHWFHHDIIEITEGRWAGALAIMTNSGDRVDYNPADIPDNPDANLYLGFPFDKYSSPVLQESIIAAGLMVIDPEDGDVLWDWNQNGALGDNQPISPDLVPYTRRGIGLTSLIFGVTPLLSKIT